MIIWIFCSAVAYLVKSFKMSVRFCILSSTLPSFFLNNKSKHTYLNEEADFDSMEVVPSCLRAKHYQQGTSACETFLIDDLLHCQLLSNWLGKLYVHDNSYRSIGFVGMSLIEHLDYFDRRRKLWKTSIRSGFHAINIDNRFAADHVIIINWISLTHGHGHIDYSHDHD